MAWPASAALVPEHVENENTDEVVVATETDWGLFVRRSWLSGPAVVAEAVPSVSALGAVEHPDRPG